MPQFSRPGAEKRGRSEAVVLGDEPAEPEPCTTSRLSCFQIPAELSTKIEHITNPPPPAYAGLTNCRKSVRSHEGLDKKAAPLFL